MKNSSLFLFDALMALYAFFVAAPILLNTVSLFTVQKRFARTMIDEGVVTAAEVQRLHPKKQLGGVLISLLVLALTVKFAIELAPSGYFCTALPFVVGLLKYRHIVQFNTLTVERFRNTYHGSMDVKKYNDYVASHF